MELMKSSREISQFHFSNFSTLYKDAAGVGSQEKFWVNIDPVNMCAVHTLPVPACSRRDAPSLQPPQLVK